MIKIRADFKKDETGLIKNYEVYMDKINNAKFDLFLPDWYLNQLVLNF